MRITREMLAGIIAEEVMDHFARLRESGEEPKPKKKSKGKGDGIGSADDAQAPDNGEHAAPNATTGSPDASNPDVNQDADPDGPAVDGDQPDPEAGDDAEDALDANGEGGEDATGAVNDEVSGKTVQAVTIDPKSKVLPGAKEVIITFNESTDPLRILVTQTGQVKFFWRGQLHDIP